MFKKDKEQSRPLAPGAHGETPSAPPQRSRGESSTTLIGGGTMVSGVLRVNGSLRIDGEAEGQVFVTDNLMVGTNGSLKAEIQTGTAVVAGHVKGRISAKGRVELQKGARLEGDVHATAFKIEDGAFFQGNCVMGEKAAESAEGAEAGRDDRLRVIGK